MPSRLWKGLPENSFSKCFLPYTGLHQSKCALTSAKYGVDEIMSCDGPQWRRWFWWDVKRCLQRLWLQSLAVVTPTWLRRVTDARLRLILHVAFNPRQQRTDQAETRWQIYGLLFRVVASPESSPHGSLRWHRRGDGGNFSVKYNTHTHPAN